MEFSTMVSFIFSTQSIPVSNCTGATVQVIVCLKKQYSDDCFCICTELRNAYADDRGNGANPNFPNHSDDCFCI